MQLVSEAHSAGKAIQKVNYNAKSKTANSSSTRKDVQSSIVIGDDTSSTTRAIAEHQAKRASSAGSSKQVAQASLSSSTAAVSKQSKSTGVASTVIQSKDQEATIKAVNTDKFASSLRESAGVQIGGQCCYDGGVFQHWWRLPATIICYQ